MKPHVIEQLVLFLWFAAENARSCIGLIRRKGDEFRNSISSVREFFCFLLLLFIILFSTPIKGVARRSNVPLQCCLVFRISVPIYFFCSLLVCHGGCNNYQVAITSPCLFDSFLDKLTVNLNHHHCRFRLVKILPVQYSGPKNLIYHLKYNKMILFQVSGLEL